MNRVVLFLPLAVLAAQETPQVLEARLLTPLSSHSAAGTTFRLRVNGAWEPGRAPVLEPGSIIVGHVRRSAPLGLGLRRERAVLDLDFDECRTPAGGPSDCKVDLVAIDNAREHIGKENQIRGVIAASHPHSWLNGIWFRPVGTLPHRAALGLTGASGMVYEKLGPTPLLGALVIGLRLAFFRLPDAEIELPSGTDMLVRVEVDTAAPPVPALPAPEDLDEELRTALASLPAEVRRSNGNPSEDVVNFAFLAGKEQLVQSFEAAGWTVTEQLTPKTFLRTYAAISAMKAYPSAPVSPLYHEGRLPEIVFQKSFNSLAKRHHIRMWKIGADRWIGAATHDTSVAFLWKKMSFTHLIDPRIDREREKLLNDLAAAGCLKGLEMLERPAITNTKLDRGEAVTDGALAVVSLKPCLPSSEEAKPVRPRRNLAKSALRRVVLETRHYLVRGSAYYLSYRGVRWATLSWRNEFSRQPGEQSQGSRKPRRSRSGEEAAGAGAEGSSAGCSSADGSECGAAENERVYGLLADCMPD
jgi:hypothetical protein